MSEMIERVARALATLSWEQHGNEHAKAEMVDRRWVHYQDQARAAIEAMLKPNNKMLHEAAKAMSPGRRPTPDRVSVNEKHKIRYQAMIREALK